MTVARSSGILLHPTSLPGPYGIGELGAEAHKFVDFLHKAGQRVWQVLPLGPTGYGDSPYQCFSAFAGNPLLISLETLVQRGYLQASDLESRPSFATDRVSFGALIGWKSSLLRKAAEAFQRAIPSERDTFEAFCQQHAAWLDEFALFMALKEVHDNVMWTKWGRTLRLREPAALDQARSELRDSIARNKFIQFEFERQWTDLKAHCASSGIRVMGDVPIYVALDSADVWANPGLFKLDDNGQPITVAGVPPDYFSATGQLWGNPIYRW